MKILGLIPARGGSKGIPQKNIKELSGKPLIQYSIEAGLGATLIEDLVVSTDDERIAKISFGLGAKVPGLRPKHLASDTSPSIDTVIHTLEYFNTQGINYDAVCLLQPTSPFRTSMDIDQSIKQFIQQKTDSLISVIKVPHQYNPYWVFLEDGAGKLRLAIGDGRIIPRRQNLPQCFIRNGAIYLTDSTTILKQKSLYGDSIGYYKMDGKKHLNIDTWEDWKQAERILSEEK